jgi:O-antigen/teichoic acid export membrane protein
VTTEPGASSSRAAASLAPSDADAPPPLATTASGERDPTLARNASYLVAGQVVTTALAIVFSAALGRSLGAEDFGLYYLITVMSTFAYVFVEWGQPFFVIREVATEPLRAGELLGTALALRAGLAVAVAIPAGLIAWALGYGGRTSWLLVLLILASLPLFLAQGYGMVFRARDQMGRDAAVSVANKVIVLGVALPALAAGAGIPGVVFAQAVAGAAALGVAIPLYRRLGTPPLRVSLVVARETLSAGTPILAMTAAIWAQPYLDVIILSKLAPANVVGWFGAAKTILGTIMAPAVILGAAAFPRLARASADTTALRREVRAAFRPLLWLAALAGTGTYLFATTAIGIVYGSRGFGPAATILEVFAPGLFLLFIDILLMNVVYASEGGTSRFAVAKILSVALGTLLDVLLIPYFQQHFGNGAIGVLVAFALSEFVVFAGAITVLRRRALEPAIALDVVRALAAAGVTILVFHLIPPVPPWLGVPLCVGTFAAASVAVGLLRREELDVLRSLARRPRILSPRASQAGS